MYQLTEEIAQKLNEEMKKIVEQDLEIKHIVMNREEAKEFYEKTNTSKGRLQFDLEENEKIDYLRNLRNLRLIGDIH